MELHGGLQNSGLCVHVVSVKLHPREVLSATNACCSCILVTRQMIIDHQGVSLSKTQIWEYDKGEVP